MAPVRRTASIAVVSFAVIAAAALPAMADPPAGHGNGNGNSSHVPPGQAKKTAAPVAPTTGTTAAPVATPTATHVPPGQAKKNNNGGNSGNGNGSNGKGGNKGKGGGALEAGHNPPGNNGTVKIHSVAGDLSHHNVAHVGCSFVVDFWGFDAGQTLNLSFVGQAPTGKGTPLAFVAPHGTSITSPDPAGGGNDFDGELPFIATADVLSVLGAPKHNGYHVRLLVATHQGGGKKQKVFWIAPCAQDTPVMPPSTASTLTLTPRHITHVTHVDTPAVLTHVPATRTASSSQLEAAPPVPSLPFTGADIGAMVTAGIVALGLGIALTVAARRRRKIG